MEAVLLEPEAQELTGGLAGVALAPVVGIELVADVGLSGVWIVDAAIAEPSPLSCYLTDRGP